ncbi:hypothetical protein HHX47_DHR2000974 [Lentinula edodes]|nr:hypothetical protein HHX47_DHR2000974 [Lentinula edodes]
MTRSERESKVTEYEGRDPREKRGGAKRRNGSRDGEASLNLLAVARALQEREREDRGRRGVEPKPNTNTRQA